MKLILILAALSVTAIAAPVDPSPGDPIFFARALPCSCKPVDCLLEVTAVCPQVSKSGQVE
jgi:hypothetical protein